MRHWLGIMILVLVFGMGCDRSHGKAKPSNAPFLNEEGKWADSLLSTLSLDQKLGQLVIYQGSPLKSIEKIKLYNALITGKLGGLLIHNLPVKSYINFIDSCQELSNIPLLIGTAEQSLLNNQFSDLVRLPESPSLRKMVSDSLLNIIDQTFIQQARALGINWRQSDQNLSPSIIYKLNQNGILNFEAANPDQLHMGASDSPSFQASIHDSFKNLVKAGLSGIILQDGIENGSTPPNLFKKVLREEYTFDGLVMAKWAPDKLSSHLSAGVDIFIVNKEPGNALLALHKAFQKGELTEEALNSKLKKILLAKYWSKKSKEAIHSIKTSKLVALQASVQPFQANKFKNVPDNILDQSGLEAHFFSPKWELFNHQLYEEAITIANDPNSLLPFSKVHQRRFQIWEFSPKSLTTFRKYFDKYAGASIRRWSTLQNGLPKLDLKKGNTHIIVLDNYKLDSKKDYAFLTKLSSSEDNKNKVILNFGRPENLKLLPASVAIIQLHEKNDILESLSAQLLFGAFKAKGQLPKEIESKVSFQTNSKDLERLKYTIPQEAGIDPRKLVGIDAIANSAIQDGVMPGCQVLVAKDGKIIYNKAFGHHTYRKQRQTQLNDLYDLASITKVGATTLALMKLYEQRKFYLNSKLGDVLPLPRSSSLKDIPLKKLMVHQSGLQVYMPVSPYLLFRDQPNADCDSFFCKNQSDTFSIKIANSFYFKKEYQQKIWDDVVQLPVYRRKRTRYSDVNFYLLQKVIENIKSRSLDSEVENNFYRPLGLRHLAFNPANKFDKKKLVPTENDRRWRQQLVQGYVHDETAALLGGVAGHAGLFSSAEDLAVIFQMLLNGGTYGGQQFLKPETIRLFTSRQYGTSRGLGFDKPSSRNHSAIAQSASSKTFGHTGFTGTCVWADPENDLIFIFLSNRVHPQARNPLLNRFEIRRRMHQVVYDALDSYKENPL